MSEIYPGSQVDLHSHSVRCLHEVKCSKIMTVKSKTANARQGGHQHARAQTRACGWDHMHCPASIHRLIDFILGSEQHEVPDSIFPGAKKRIGGGERASKFVSTALLVGILALARAAHVVVPY